MEQSRNNGDNRKRPSSYTSRSGYPSSSSDRRASSYPRKSPSGSRASSGSSRSSAPSSYRYERQPYRSGYGNAPSQPRNGEKKQKPPKKKNPFLTFLKSAFLLSVFVFFAAAGIAIGAYLGIIKSAPKLEMLSIEPNVYTSIIYDMNGNEIDRLHGDENREYVVLENIPINLQNAIIAIEDERFYNHNGVDAKSVARAVYVTVKSKLGGDSRMEGASTITQQLIKNNVTKVTRNTIKTKIQEQYLAVEYEKELEKQLGSKKAAKDYILELYLNTIGLNHGYSGVQAAALGYFNKDVSELDLAESACLAGITNNPSYYTPRVHPENNKQRQQKILSNMLEQGYITKEEYSQAIKEDIYSRISDTANTQQNYGSVIHSYFVDALFEQISSDLQQQYKISSAQANNYLYNSGLQIYSTFAPDIQKVVDDAYLDDSLFPKVNYGIEVSYTVSVQNSSTGKQNHTEYKQFVKNREEADTFVANKKAEIENELSSRESIIADKAVYTVEPQSAMVIMDYRTGEVKALAGGRGEKLVNRGFNRATDSARQPGSVFKVLAAFAPGIDLGKLTPATVFDDVPYSVGNYSPKNWYTNPPYRGLSTIRDAIRDSMNIIAVKAMVYTGIDSCYDYLLNFGFTTLENDNHASTALGGLTRGVTQLEVTAAFGAIANGGEYKRPMLYSKVLDHEGNVLLENNQEPKQVLKKTSAYLLTDMMRDVVKSGTGTAARFKNSQMPVSGKTGTSQESRDLTFVGFTPYYVAGIWLGFDNYDDTVKNMSNLDQSAHTALWRTIMEKIHEGLPVKEFEKPNGIVSASICTESGKLASSICSSDTRGTIRTEYFAQGTQPTEYCNVHKAVSVCSASGMSPSKYCPASSIVTRAGIVRPEPYNGSETVADRIYEVGVGRGICNVHTEQSVQSEENTEEDTDKENTDEQKDTDENNTDNEYQGSEMEPEVEAQPQKPDVSIGEVIPSVPDEPPAAENKPPEQPVMPDVSSVGTANAAADGFEFN